MVGKRGWDTNRVAVMVVGETTGPPLQGFVKREVVPGTTIYTDESTAYTRLPNHDVKSSVSEQVGGRVRSNGTDGFWSALKPARKGRSAVSSQNTRTDTWVNSRAATTCASCTDWRPLCPVWIVGMIPQGCAHCQSTLQAIAQTLAGQSICNSPEPAKR